MMRSTARVPQPRLHKPTGQAYVRLNKKFVYLGKHGSPEAQAAYDALVAEWLASGRTLEVQPRRAVAPAERLAAPVDLTINELAVKWLEWADGYYVKDGRRTKEVEIIRLALRPLLRLFGPAPARELGPMRLKAVRKAMIEGDLCRAECNRRTGIIVRMYRWAVEHELVPSPIWEALRAVPGLKKGRTEAPDRPPRQPVTPEVLEATLPHLAPMIRDMVRLQHATAMRTGELVILRARDVEEEGEVWVYRPAGHKTEHHGRARPIFIGPEGQKALAPYLDRSDPEAFAFSPAMRMASLRAKQREARRTSVQPSQHGRRKASPRRAPGSRYTVRTYAQAIERAIEKVNATRAGQGAVPLPKWSPYCLRHAAATAIRAAHGLEAAQVILGHSKANVTQVYARASEERARDVAKAMG